MPLLYCYKIQHPIHTDNLPQSQLGDRECKNMID